MTKPDRSTVSNIFVKKQQDDFTGECAAEATILEKGTRELLANMTRMGRECPEFQLACTVRLLDSRRYKFAVTCNGFPRVDQTLSEIHEYPGKHHSFQRLVHNVQSPSVCYLEKAKAIVKEPQNPFVSEFLGPRQLDNGDFDLAMTLTLDHSLTYRTNIEVNDNCSMALKRVLTEGDHRDMCTIWNPMKSVVYYVVYHTFAAMLRENL